MLDDDTQDRTEQATPKKEKESKERGLVARSKDFNSLVVLLFGCVAFLIFGKLICTRMYNIFHHFFVFDGYSLRNNDFMLENLKRGLQDGFTVLLPIMLLILIASIVGVLLIGGWSFSFGNVAPKFERLDPIKGLMKIFSIKSLMELFKSVLKVVLVICAGISVYCLFFKDILTIAQLDLLPGITESVRIMVYSFFVLTASLIIVCFFDVPYQIWDYRRQLMMTKHEVREEYKETEGKPEVKSKLRRMQREMASRRMMEEIPHADVIITNPTHFAVALKYDQSKMKAPIVLAKGADLVAHRIIEIGKENLITTVSMPPLARSIFYHTDIGDEIPQKLYIAVAQILAYVYQLKQYRRGKSKKPTLPTQLDIPHDMLR